MGQLNGKVAVVTGAGRGIGASVARGLASEGASVVVNDLGVTLQGEGSDNSPAEQVVNEIERAGGQAVPSYEDIAEHEAAERLMKTAVSEFGRLDILVNVAGILRDRMIFKMSEEEWDAVIRVHLKGTFNTTKWASSYWRENRDPKANYRLINFTSGSGLLGAPGQPNYAAAKMGIVGLTYSCANALRQYGVTSNAIAPRADTRMIDVVPEEVRKNIFAATDNGSPDGPAEDNEWSPENVSPIVNYVASDASSWLNGRVIRSQGYQISLYSNPEMIRQIVSPGRWDPQALAEAIEASFRPAVEEPQPLT